MLEQLDDLTIEFEEVQSLYSSLNDSDVEDAFYIMKASSSLQSSFEKLSADLQHQVFVLERTAKAVQASVSRASSSKVNEGDRIAASSEEVLNAWNKVAEVQKNQRYIDSTAKFLSRMYFDTKLIYENACRAMRNPVGGEKLVGRT